MVDHKRRKGEEGAGLLIILMIGVTVSIIALTAAVQSWSVTWRRDSEEELIARGNMYVDAILAYRKDHGGQFPTNLEDLAEQGPRRVRYIRRLYEDPIAPNGKWGLLYLMPGGQGIYDPGPPSAWRPAAVPHSVRRAIRPARLCRPDSLRSTRIRPAPGLRR